MAEQDIYKIVEEMNRNKVSNDTKIDSIYGILDEVKRQNEKETSRKVNLQFKDTLDDIDEDVVKHAQTRLSDLKGKVKPARKPGYPTEIRDFEKRSDCFMNIIAAVDYGDNNVDYVEGHRSALEKYYNIANNNPKEFYIVEGRANDELKSLRGNVTNTYTKGYRDGIEYVVWALNKSKVLLNKKINQELLKELS